MADFNELIGKVTGHLTAEELGLPEGASPTLVGAERLRVASNMRHYVKVVEEDLLAHPAAPERAKLYGRGLLESMATDLGKAGEKYDFKNALGRSIFQSYNTALGRLVRQFNVSRSDPTELAQALEAERRTGTINFALDQAKRIYTDPGADYHRALRFQALVDRLEEAQDPNWKMNRKALGIEGLSADLDLKDPVTGEKSRRLLRNAWNAMETGETPAFVLRRSLPDTSAAQAILDEWPKVAEGLGVSLGEEGAPWGPIEQSKAARAFGDYLARLPANVSREELASGLVARLVDSHPNPRAMYAAAGKAGFGVGRAGLLQAVRSSELPQARGLLAQLAKEGTPKMGWKGKALRRTGAGSAAALLALGAWNLVSEMRGKKEARVGPGEVGKGIKRGLGGAWETVTFPWRGPPAAPVAPGVPPTPQEIEKKRQASLEDDLRKSLMYDPRIAQMFFTMRQGEEAAGEELESAKLARGLQREAGSVAALEGQSALSKSQIPILVEAVKQVPQALGAGFSAAEQYRQDQLAALRRATGQ
jgi:hypothetical protein